VYIIVKGVCGIEGRSVRCKSDERETTGFDAGMKKECDEAGQKGANERGTDVSVTKEDGVGRVGVCPNDNVFFKGCVVGAVRSRKNESQMRIEVEKK
jgi:hypothetical protein